MNNYLYNEIRDVLENTPGLTQKGLAEHMGVNPAAVNRMLYGRRNIMAEEIPIIEDYLGVELHLSPPSLSAFKRVDIDPEEGLQKDSHVPSVESIQSSQMDVSASIPVYGDVSQGLQKRLNISKKEAIDWVLRHPAQVNIRDAFAVYIVSEDMVPRYFEGELIYLHPGRPLKDNQDFAFEMKDGNLLIRRLLKQKENSFHVKQFSPEKEMDLLKSDLKAIYAVVGRG